MKDFLRSDGFKVCVFMVIVTAFMLFMLVWMPHLSTVNSCQREAADFGMEWRVLGQFGTCEVYTPDLGWWDLYDYKKIIVTKQLLGK